MGSLLGLVFTHLYRGYVKRNHWGRLTLWRLVPRVVFSSILIALAMSVLIFLSLIYVFELLPTDQVKIGVAFTMVFNLSATILLWSLIYFGLHYFWDYKKTEVEKWKLEASIKDAELNALKSQINPHFLFNSLNSLRALILEDPPRAQHMVTQLAGLLRTSLQANGTATVSLEEELKTVKTYLDLESIRLEERLRYDIDVDEAALEIAVPTMLVQTLVENGIKHGVAERPQGGDIQVSSRLNGEALHIQVVSSGQLQNKSPATGVGLHNARERLRLLFGEDASLTLSNTTEDTVAAQAHIPLEAQP